MYYRFGFDGDEVTNNETYGFSGTNTLGEISQARSKAGKRSKTKAGCSTSEKSIQVDYSIGNYDAWEYTWTVTKNIEYEGETYTSITPILSGTYSSTDSEKDFHEEVSVPEGEYQFNIYVSDPPCTTSFQSILHAASLHASLCPDTSHTCN